MTTYRHKKRGTIYKVLGEAEVQISGLPNGRVLKEGDKLVVYMCWETGKLWVRFPDEFHDGRFEVIE